MGQGRGAEGVWSAKPRSAAKDTSAKDAKTLAAARPFVFFVLRVLRRLRVSAIHTPPPLYGCGPYNAGPFGVHT